MGGGGGIDIIRHFVRRSCEIFYVLDLPSNNSKPIRQSSQLYMSKVVGGERGGGPASEPSPSSYPSILPARAAAPKQRVRRPIAAWGVGGRWSGIRGKGGSWRGRRRRGCRLCPSFFILFNSFIRSWYVWGRRKGGVNSLRRSWERGGKWCGVNNSRFVLGRWGMYLFKVETTNQPYLFFHLMYNYECIYCTDTGLKIRYS